MDVAEQIDVLRRERSLTGIFLDFDGTLAPVIEDPEAAAIVPGGLEILTGLARLYPLVAFISGRGAADLYPRVGIEGPRYFGLYGAEEMTASGLLQAPEAAEWRRIVAKLSDQATELIRAQVLTGCEVENKDLALSLHYRHSGRSEAPEALASWATQAAADHGFQLGAGRMVLELKPPTVSKGEAFLRLAGESGVRNALIAGDDSADVDMMQRSAGAVPGVLLRVGVLSGEAPPGMLENSDYQVGSPQEVVELLERLL
ncbi:MAG: trehalose-phosphatase [Actinomycetota bacterium]